MSKLSFHQGPGRYEQVVKLDGEDISSAIRGLSFTVDAGDLPTVDLQLAVFEIEADGGFEARVHIAEETVELLKRLGWASPELVTGAATSTTAQEI